MQVDKMLSTIIGWFYYIDVNSGLCGNWTVFKCARSIHLTFHNYPRSNEKLKVYCNSAKLWINSYKISKFWSPVWTAYVLLNALSFTHSSFVWSSRHPKLCFSWVCFCTEKVSSIQAIDFTQSDTLHQNVFRFFWNPTFSRWYTL